MSVMLAASSGLIKWGLLGKILWLSAGISIGLIVLFTVAVNSLSAYRRDGEVAAGRALNGVIVLVTSAAILATLMWGLYYVVHK
jgi:hypothetical protein